MKKSPYVIEKLSKLLLRVKKNKTSTAVVLDMVKVLYGNSIAPVVEWDWADINF